MATFDITVLAGTSQGASHDVATAFTEPGDFDGATIDSVQVISSPTMSSDAESDDTAIFRWWIQTSGGTAIFGNNTANGAICDVNWGPSVSESPLTIADDTLRFPNPTIAVAADWDEIRGACTYTANMMGDAELFTWSAFTIRVTYTPAASGETASGDGPVPAVTAAGTAVVHRAASGSPSIAPVEGAGTTKVHRAASGDATLASVEAAGTAKVVHPGSGNPSIAAVEASGNAKVVHPASGSPSIPVIEAAGAAKVHRAASGAPSIAAIEAAGTAKVVHPASGSPSIAAIEASGAASVEVNSAAGDGPVPAIEAAGSATVHRAASGSPSIAAVSASGNAKVVHPASGSPSIAPIEAAGTADVAGVISASGGGSIGAIEAAGAAKRVVWSQVNDLTNEIFWSDDISDAVWIKNDLSITGTNQLVEDGSDGSHGIQSSAFNTVDAAQYSISFEGTANGRSSVLLRMGAAGFQNNVGKFFNLATGSLGNDFSFAPDSASITALGGGKYLCQMQITADEAGNTRAILGLADDNDFTYQGDGVSGAIIENFQVEINRRAGDRVLTQATAVSVAGAVVPATTASGSAIVHRAASGAASIAPVEASGNANVGAVKTASGDGPVPAIEAAGAATVRKVATGNPSIAAVQAAGSATVRRVSSGSAIIAAVSASGFANVHKVASGSAIMAAVMASGIAVVGGATIKSIAELDARVIDVSLDARKIDATLDARQITPGLDAKT